MKRNDSRMFLRYLCATLMLVYCPMALAYIGPGLGAGVVATVLGIVAGIAMLLIGVIWYPVKRLLGRFRSKK
jgi:hypothetical protein